jgi:hypothetical protein
MDAKHADGPEAGRLVHGHHHDTAPWRAAPARQPQPHLRVLRASAYICVESCLLRRMATRCRDERQGLARQPRPCTNSQQRMPPPAPAMPGPDVAPCQHAGSNQARFDADSGRWTRNTRMDLKPAGWFTATTMTPRPGGLCRRGSHDPICVFRVHPPASALSLTCFAAWRRGAATNARALRASQDPVHQFSPLFRQGKTAAHARQDPMHQDPLPDRRRPSSRRTGNETMLRPVRRPARPTIVLTELSQIC